MINKEFMPQKGYYRNLRVYQISECIYDITYFFAHKFLSKGDRTIDQMIQSARSGKQNIAEGSSAGATSKETEIKLTNVAKASLQELLIDYEDYLRVRNLEIWDKSGEKALKTREVCRRHNDSNYYRAQILNKSDESIANLTIILIHQADVLLNNLIERQKKDFLQYGGIREQMFQARRDYRSQSSQSAQSARSAQSAQSGNIKE